MSLRLLSAALCAALLTFGAAQVYAEDAKAPAAQAIATADGGSLGPPPPGKGLVVFFRPSKIIGMAISYKVREGETELGTLSNGKYVVQVADPGKHSYVVHSEAKDTLNLEIEAGETYYVEGTMSMGALVYRPNLVPSDRDSFMRLAPKLKLAKDSK